MRFAVPAVLVLFAALLPVAGAAGQALAPSVASVRPAEPNPSIPASGRIAFQVVREGVDIGRHLVAFQRQGELLQVDVTIDLNVTFLGMSLYRYSHRARETWRDDRLVALTTDTNKNGEIYAVRGRADGGRFIVDAAGTERAFPANAMPSSHWNRAWIDGRPLINTQTGESIAFTATPLGRESVVTATGSRPGEHFAISGDLTKDIWFDARGRWIGSRFKAPDGSTVSYVLE